MNSTFTFPDLKKYSKQKGLRVKRHYTRTQLSEQEAPLSELFERRIFSVLKGSDPPGIYPGNFISTPGSVNSYTNRGSSFYDQYMHFRKLGWFESERVQIKELDVPSPLIWQFPAIKIPRLKYLHAQTNRWFGNARKPSREDVFCGLSFIESMNAVRKLWGVNNCNYTLKAICFGNKYFSLIKRSNPDKTVEALFELEALLSYLSASEGLPQILSGTLYGNWVEVHKIELESIKQTELCVTSRIKDELKNLCSTTFAPIVINEYKSVADGNHRLTTSWIWNLLVDCLSTKWGLTEEFQSAVEKSCTYQKLQKFPVSLHETLYHLGLILSNIEEAELLERTLKPVMFNTKSEIKTVPVLVLPEYLSCASNKEEYDTGNGIKRVHPSVYERMADIPNLVLPARASYHYTDRVLLPWFKVID